MKKHIKDLTPEEFQKTFPITLEAHQDCYAQWYEEEKERILQVTDQSKVVRINHIGSSAVPKLIAKPVIDILLEVDGTCHIDSMLEALKTIDFGVEMTNRTENPFRMLLTKGMTVDGFAQKVFLLHIRYAGDWKELYFRDYLLAHPEVAEEYGALKEKIVKDIEDGRLERMPNGQPNGYSQAKFAFVEEKSLEAKKEFGARYQIGTNRESKGI